MNFRRGANPPREEWKRPRQRPAAETEAAYRRFESYLDYQLSLPGVKHVTASELATIYRNRLREEGADLATVRDIAERLARDPSLDFVRDSRGRFVSPAEQFSLVTSFLVRWIAEGRLPARVEVSELSGPYGRPPAAAWPAFPDAPSTPPPTRARAGRPPASSRGRADRARGLLRAAGVALAPPIDAARPRRVPRWC